MSNKMTNFVADYTWKPCTVLVTIVQLPTGAKEVITNTTNLKEKVDYITQNYNENLELIHNNDVKIIGYVFA